VGVASAAEGSEHANITANKILPVMRGLLAASIRGGQQKRHDDPRIVTAQLRGRVQRSSCLALACSFFLGCASTLLDWGSSYPSLGRECKLKSTKSLESAGVR
jgi:hypothetical protein